MAFPKRINIAKAVTTVHRLSMDEEFRMQYEAREDRVRQQLAHDYWDDTEIKKRGATISEQQTASRKKTYASQNQMPLSPKKMPASLNLNDFSQKNPNLTIAPAYAGAVCYTRLFSGYANTSAQSPQFYNRFRKFIFPLAYRVAWTFVYLSC
jgi:hypothetical protein